MPKTLDLLIGLATIMLFFSLATTVLTNGFIGAIGLRGVCLNRGLRRLLRQIWPALSVDDAATLAGKLLTHPMIGVGSRTLLFARQGEVIQREEVFFLVLEFATGDTPDPLEDALRMKLVRLLQSSGVADPETTLAEARDYERQLEIERPDAAAYQRKSAAILAASASSFVSKLFGWFDQTIDRVSNVFTMHTRLLSLLAAVLITVTFQLDSVWMIQRLSAEDSFRQSIVSASADVTKTADKLQGEAARPVKTEAQDLEQIDREFAEYGLIRLPFGSGRQASETWLTRWRQSHLWIGCMLSILLLTLGAPFWYSTLQSLIKIKSSLAQTDDAQRAERQSAAVGTNPNSVEAG